MRTQGEIQDRLNQVNDKINEIIAKTDRLNESIRSAQQPLSAEAIDAEETSAKLIVELCILQGQANALSWMLAA